MKPEKQRVAIVEACGWKPETYWAQPIEPGDIPVTTIPPNYPFDLNAMREVSDTLNDDQQWQFIQHLNNITRNTDHNDPDDWFVRSTDWTWRMVNASAAQRAEAFLRTIGKWETSQ